MRTQAFSCVCDTGKADRRSRTSSFSETGSQLNMSQVDLQRGNTNILKPFEFVSYELAQFTYLPVRRHFEPARLFYTCRWCSVKSRWLGPSGSSCSRRDPAPPPPFCLWNADLLLNRTRWCWGGSPWFQRTRRTRSCWSCWAWARSGSPLSGHRRPRRRRRSSGAEPGSAALRSNINSTIKTNTYTKKKKKAWQTEVNCALTSQHSTDKHRAEHGGAAHIHLGKENTTDEFRLA